MCIGICREALAGYEVLYDGVVVFWRRGLLVMSDDVERRAEKWDDVWQVVDPGGAYTSVGGHLMSRGLHKKVTI